MSFPFLFYVGLSRWSWPRDSCSGLGGCHRWRNSGGSHSAMQDEVVTERSKGLRKTKQNQRDRSRQSLHEQDPAADGHSAVNTGNDDADQKEYLDLEGKGGNALQQPPNQAGGEEAVIEALIGGEHRGIGGLFE